MWEHVAAFGKWGNGLINQLVDPISDEPAENVVSTLNELETTLHDKQNLPNPNKTPSPNRIQTVSSSFFEENHTNTVQNHSKAETYDKTSTANSDFFSSLLTSVRDREPDEDTCSKNDKLSNSKFNDDSNIPFQKAKISSFPKSELHMPSMMTLDFQKDKKELAEILLIITSLGAHRKRFFESVRMQHLVECKRVTYYALDANCLHEGESNSTLALRNWKKRNLIKIDALLQGMAMAPLMYVDGVPVGNTRVLQNLEDDAVLDRILFRKICPSCLQSRQIHDKYCRTCKIPFRILLDAVHFETQVDSIEWYKQSSKPAACSHEFQRGHFDNWSVSSKNINLPQKQNQARIKLVNTVNNANARLMLKRPTAFSRR